MPAATLSPRAEIKLFFAIALPLSAAYLAEFAMFVITKMIVGRLGYESLAAVGIAGDLSFEVLVILMAMLSIVGVLGAQAHGAGQTRELGRVVQQGLVVAGAIAIPAMMLIWNLDLAMAATGQDPVVVERAREFLRSLAPCVPAVLGFAVLRNFVAVMGRTLPVLVITVVAVALNYLLTLWLVHGGLGLPALGLFGAGLAMTLVSWFMFAALALHVFALPRYRGFGIFGGSWRPRWPICREIVVLGLPVAGLAFFEAGLFVATAILSGIVGVETLAAYQIVIAWAGIPFVIAFGMAEATMIRVAHAVGREHAADRRRAGFLGMGLVLVLLAGLLIVPLAFADVIVRIFISADDPGFDEVAALATTFLAISALFLLFDGLQATAARALRGMKDNIVPLWIAGFGYWVLGIGGGAWLAFGFGLDGVGLWWGLAAGLAVAGCLLAWRFHRLTRIG